MKSDIAALWIDALRSGLYAQGDGRLTTIMPSGDKEYCCLGVLCELAVEAGVIDSVDDDVRVGYGPYMAEYLPPTEVVEWAGLHSEDGEFSFADENGFQSNSLVSMNDNQYENFSAIAYSIAEHAAEL